VEALGHEVHVAFDGPRGLELARQVKPDIAFVDIGLPGMDGFELTRRMRQMPACAMIPIIAVSGYASEIDRDAARRAGVSQHFAKPINLACLKEIVERAGRTAEPIVTGEPSSGA
jgi:CheY-like chemotaxis protein